MLHPIVHPAHTRCRPTKIKQTATSEQRDTIGARLNFVTGVSSDHTKGFCWGMQPGTGLSIYMHWGPQNWHNKFMNVLYKGERTTYWYTVQRAQLEALSNGEPLKKRPCAPSRYWYMVSSRLQLTSQQALVSYKMTWSLSGRIFLLANIWNWLQRTPCTVEKAGISIMVRSFHFRPLITLRNSISKMHPEAGSLRVANHSVSYTGYLERPPGVVFVIFECFDNYEIILKPIDRRTSQPNWWGVFCPTRIGV